MANRKGLVAAVANDHAGVGAVLIEDAAVADVEHKRRAVRVDNYVAVTRERAEDADAFLDRDGGSVCGATLDLCGLALG
jgi:hypothetical protein